MNTKDHTLKITHCAQAVIDATGIHPMSDVARLRAGELTEAALLGECLDGADDDHVQGWREYVDAVVAYADRVRIARVEHALGAYTTVSTDALHVRLDGEPSDCIGRVDSSSTARDTNAPIVSLRTTDGSIADRREILAIIAHHDKPLLHALRELGALL